jgi:glyoxylase-like metal-dependent hydrolase (beta-lactamase superfamily II)
VELPPPSAPGDPVRQLAENVWMVRGGGYWSLVVGYADHVLVVEAPGGGTGEVLSKIRELAPGKPVRYVIPTHHHDDHAGGMRDYIAEGATIVTTAGNRSYFERMARARPTIRLDALARAPRPPRFEILADRRRVFSGGGPTVEIRDIGPSPHADEMLIAWLPDQGILFQGDLLNLAAGIVYPNTANATTAHFAQWLDRTGLEVKILAGVHMLPGPRAQLDEALRVSDVDP